MTHASQGFKVGRNAVASGLIEGAQGLFYKPIHGAMDQGAKGFIKGVGHGLLGAVAKPLSGARLPRDTPAVLCVTQ
jgi:vacuolar protein sorting-associated protein 13A/C